MAGFDRNDDVAAPVVVCAKAPLEATVAIAANGIRTYFHTDFMWLTFLFAIYSG